MSHRLRSVSGMTLVIALLLAGRTEAIGQYMLRGYVLDDQRKPVSAVKVYVKDSYDFVKTTTSGVFTLTLAGPGDYRLVADADNGAPVEVPVTIGPDTAANRELTILLPWHRKDLAGVTVRATTTSPISDRIKAEVMNRIDILTTAGANADITAALKTLPGTQQSVSQDGLFVRGGTGSETQVIVDGLAVNNFYYSGAPDVTHRGRFPPSLFKGNFFSSGGYSAQFGQALSSVLVLETEALPTKSSMDFNIGSVGLSATANILSKDETYSYGGSINYLNLRPYFKLVKQEYDFIKMPDFIDVNYFFRIRTKKKGMLKMFASYTDNSLSLYRQNIDYSYRKDFYGVASKNFFGIVSFNQALPHDWTIDAAASLSANSGKYQLGQRDSTEYGNYFDSVVRNNSVQGKLVLKKRFSTNSQLTAGVDYQHYLPYLWVDSLKGEPSHSNTDNLGALFVEGSAEVIRGVNLRAGVRGEYSSLLRRADIAPRAMLDIKLPARFHMSFAYGEFYQKPPDHLLLYKPDMNFLKATHYIAGIQKVTPNQQTFRVEAFYKKYSRLPSILPDTSTGGYGYASGFELFWRKKIPDKGLECWISYSYLNSKRKFMDYPIYTQPSFVSNHSLSLVAKRYFDHISTHIALSYTYENGKPYYDPGKPDALFLSERTRDYYNMNLSVAHVRNIGKLYSIFVLTVSNLFNNTQVFGYRYSGINSAVRQPITPMANRFIYLGAFFSLGIDRTTDEFNRHL